MLDQHKMAQECHKHAVKCVGASLEIGEASTGLPALLPDLGKVGLGRRMEEVGEGSRIGLLVY